MHIDQLGLILTTLGVLLTAFALGELAALLTAIFVCGLVLGALTRRGP